MAPSRIGHPASARDFARPYRTVGGRMAPWQGRGQIRQDDEPALYLHEYTAAGITIRGLVGAVDISHPATTAAESAILPHEGIRPAQADELADRMAQMKVNPAPILLVYRAPVEVRALLQGLIATPPDHQFTDRNEQRHRLWALRDPDDLAAIAAAIADSRAMIADGHHRYAAYLRLQRRDPGGANDYGLAMLVDQDDTPLFLAAIHRVLAGTTLDDLRAAAEAAGAVLQETTRERAVDAMGPHTLVVTDHERWGTLELTIPPDRAAVEILHDQLIPALPRGPSRIGYHHSVEDTLGHVSPTIGVAVLLPAPDVDLVMRIVETERMLPEKATSFQPKPSLGVLIRSLHDE